MAYLKWLGGSVLALFVALALFVLFGLNLLRGPISSAVSSATGRELRIEGDLRPIWSWAHPRFRAEGVTFMNPDWAREDVMFQADAVEASLSVLPLLLGRVVVPGVHLENAVVHLEHAADGRKNWLFEKDQKKDGGSRLFIRGLTLDRGRLTYLEPARETDIEARLSSEGEGIAFEASGTYKGLKSKIAGQGGPVLGLRDADTPYPLKANAKIGATTLSAEGTLTEVVGLRALELKIELSGQSMSQLYEVFGIAFPETSPYTTRGKLIRDKDKALVRYEEFSGKVGESDLAGTFQVTTADPGSGKRPFMHGELTSKVLNFADLGPLVGTNQPKKGGVLPDSPFDSKRWDSVDADVTLKAGTIKRPRQLPLENLSTRIRMRDKVLSLDPLEFGIAGGRLIGPLVLDGREDLIRAQARLKVQKLQLSKLFPTIKESQASIGAVTGLIELTGSGNSVAKMLGSSQGKIGLYVDGGKMSAFLAQLIALDMWGVARVKLSGEAPVDIRCAIADFGVKDGIARANGLVFDTSVVNVSGEGSVNFKTEALDFKLVPDPKDKSIASLKSPLYVRGTLGDPQVAPDMKKLAAKGVGAIVMGILNPLLAILPLLEEGEGKDSNCAKLIAQATSSARSAASGATKSRPPAKSEPQTPRPEETRDGPPGSRSPSGTPVTPQ